MYKAAKEYIENNGGAVITKKQHDDLYTLSKHAEELRDLCYPVAGKLMDQNQLELGNAVLQIGRDLHEFCIEFLKND